MTNLEEYAAAAPPRVDADTAGGDAGFDDMFARVAGRFAQAGSRKRARAYVRGLLSGVERKNGWQLAEHAGDASPDGMQRLLNFYAWDADAVRDDARAYVVDHLGDPAGVLVVDETGFLKKGTKSVGVQRQYTGTAGRIENAQVGVFLAYAGPAGRALIDRELYLPDQSWARDAVRRAEAGVPEKVRFATKPQLALRMIQRAHAAGVPFAWVAGDEVYGSSRELARWLEEHRICYVLEVACDHQVGTGVGRRRVDALAALVPDSGWQLISAGDGAKGPRYYQWALVETTDVPRGCDLPRHLLVRRSVEDPTELAYFLTHASRPAPLRELVAVAGTRWAIESCFQSGKNETGLDQYQVRLWHAWYRHITLAMLAHAWLAVTAATSRNAHDPAAAKGSAISARPPPTAPATTSATNPTMTSSR